MIPVMTRWCLALVFTVAAALVSAAQKPPDVNVDNIGPKIGDVAPDFEAPDQHGAPRRLSTLLGSKGAMLVFYRSADW
jgi:cytochrome oxidase Cu insertion factor (SCO1/SenC/PrrC family)